MTFTARMEAAALYQLREAFADGKDEAGCIAHAVKAMGREYGALIRRVWQANFVSMGPN